MPCQEAMASNSIYGNKSFSNSMKRKYTDSIDYLLGGSLTLRNGRIDQYQFEEGYCQAEVYSNTIDKFTFCYYDQDHLGNIRQVTKADGSTKGKVIQKVNYYPFGLQLCDGTTDSNVQSHRYNNKLLLYALLLNSAHTMAVAMATFRLSTVVRSAG